MILDVDEDHIVQTMSFLFVEVTVWVVLSITNGLDQLTAVTDIIINYSNLGVSCVWWGKLAMANIEWEFLS
jgi:hypothetical protein